MNLPVCLRLAREIGIDLQSPPEWWRFVDGKFADPAGRGGNYDADLVLASFVPGTDHPAIEALIITPQLDFEPQKATAWLVQRAGVASRYGAGAQWLLVVSPNQAALNRYRDEVYERNPELMPRLVGPDAVPLPMMPR